MYVYMYLCSQSVLLLCAFYRLARSTDRTGDQSHYAIGRSRYASDGSPDSASIGRSSNNRPIAQQLIDRACQLPAFKRFINKIDFKKFLPT